MAIGLEVTVPITHTAYDRKVGDYVRMPVISGLMGQWFLGGSADFSARNRWSKGGYGGGEVYGSPVFANHYASLKGGQSGITLPFSDSAEMTWVMVVRNTDTLADNDHRPLFIGTTPAGIAGANTFFFNTTQARMSVYYDGATVASNNTLSGGVGLTAWHLLIGTFSASQVVLYDMTDADSSPQAATGTRTLAAGPIAIAGNPGATINGTFDAAYYGVLNRVITSDERTAIKNWASAYFAPLGITV